MNLHRKSILIASICAVIALFLPSMSFPWPEEMGGPLKSSMYHGDGDSWVILFIATLPAFLVFIGRRPEPLPRPSSTLTILSGIYLCSVVWAITNDPYLSPLIGTYLLGATSLSLTLLGLISFRASFVVGNEEKA